MNYASEKVPSFSAAIRVRAAFKKLLPHTDCIMQFDGRTYFVKVPAQYRLELRACI